MSARDALRALRCAIEQPGTENTCVMARNGTAMRAESALIAGARCYARRAQKRSPTPCQSPHLKVAS